MEARPPCETVTLANASMSRDVGPRRRAVSSTAASCRALVVRFPSTAEVVGGRRLREHHADASTGTSAAETVSALLTSALSVVGARTVTEPRPLICSSVQHGLHLTACNEATPAWLSSSDKYGRAHNYNRTSILTCSLTTGLDTISACFAGMKIFRRATALCRWRRHDRCYHRLRSCAQEVWPL